jgi:hypothetical protein
VAGTSRRRVEGTDVERDGPLIDVDLTSVDRVLQISCLCRSGGTALLTEFARRGLDAYFQPMKTCLRHGLLGAAQRTRLQSDRGVAVVKEAFGPYFRSEAAYNPIAELRRAGLSCSQLVLLSAYRDPERIAASWQTWFAPRAPSGAIDWAIFRRAAAQVEMLRRYCGELGIQQFDVICDGDKRTQDATLERLLTLLLGTNASGPAKAVIMPPEPEHFRIPGIHRKVRESAGFAPEIARQSELTSSDFRASAVVTKPIRSAYRAALRRTRKVSLA